MSLPYEIRNNSREILYFALEESKESSSNENITSEDLCIIIEQLIYQQNNCNCGDQYKEKIQKLKNRLTGKNNDFIRKMLKNRILHAKTLCELSDEELMNDNYLKNIGSNLNNKNPIKDKKVEKEEKDIKNEIRDYLKCYMCLSKLTKPQMCKYCKKISCKNCNINWLQNHDYCVMCKNKLNTKDLIDLPFLDDMTNYFIHNIESNQNEKENNNKNLINSKNQLNNEKEENKNICQIHNNKNDYYCIQCNKHYCSKCLIFFGNESNKHKGHIIIQNSKINDLGIEEALKEFNKLPDTKNILEKLINLCKLKIRENEIKKCQITNFMNLFKEQYIHKINEVSNELEKILKKLEVQRDSVETSIAAIPNGFNNIINNNDYFQGKIVFQELQKYNEIERNLENNIKYKSEINPKIFIENYESDYFEIEFPSQLEMQNDGKDIFNKKIDVIPGFPGHLILTKLNKNIFFSFSIDINLPLNAPNYPRFYSYLIIDSKKFGQDFGNLYLQIFPQDLIQNGNKNGNMRQQVDRIEFDDKFLAYLYGQKFKMKIVIKKVYFN